MNLGQLSTPRAAGIVGIVAAILVFFAALIAVADSFIEEVIDARVQLAVAEIERDRDLSSAIVGGNATVGAAERTAQAQENAAKTTVVLCCQRGNAPKRATAPGGKGSSCASLA